MSPASLYAPDDLDLVLHRTRFTSLKNATGDEAINQALAIIQQARDNITPEEGETARAAVEYLVGDAALEHVLIPTLEVRCSSHWLTGKS